MWLYIRKMSADVHVVAQAAIVAQVTASTGHVGHVAATQAGIVSCSSWQLSSVGVGRHDSWVSMAGVHVADVGVQTAAT